MRKAVQKLDLITMLLVSTMSFSGCFWLLFGAAAGASGYAWVSGSLVKEFDASALEVQSAATKAFDDLDLDLIEERSDRLSAKYHSEFADGKNVKVDITAVTERTSKIKIRVGIIGDREKSEMIYNAMMKYL